MDYSPDICERIDSLSKKCQEKKKVMSDFIGLLQARAELEEYYSRNLEKIADSLTKLIHGKDSLKDIFITLRSYLHIQTEQTRTFARQIKNDVIAELENFLNNETQWQKNMAQMKSKHQKEIRKNIDTLNTLRDEYIYSLQEEKKFQQNSQIVKRFNYQQLEVRLQNFIQYYNQYIEQYFHDIAMVQDTFQNIEIERRKQIQDGSLKYLMFEISVIRNLQYDLSGITSKLEIFDPGFGMGELFKEGSTDKPLLCKLNFENYRTFLHQQLNFTVKKKKPIFENQDAKIDIQIPPNQVYVKMFQSAMFNNIISDNIISRLQEQLAATGPQTYVDALERVMALKLNNQAQHQLEPEGYVSLMKLLTPLLDYCNQYNSHGDCVKKALQLSKVIFKVIQSPDKVETIYTLYDGLGQHAVLNNQQLWVNYIESLNLPKVDDGQVFDDNNIVQDQNQQQINDNLQSLLDIGCSNNITSYLKQYLMQQ